MLVDLNTLTQPLFQPLSGYVLVRLETAERISLYSLLGKESFIICPKPGEYILHVRRGDIIVQGNLTCGNSHHITNDVANLVKNNMVRLNEEGAFEHVTQLTEGLTLEPEDMSLANLNSLLFNKGDVEVRGIEYRIPIRYKVFIAPTNAEAVIGDSVSAMMDLDLRKGELMITVDNSSIASDTGNVTVDVDTFMRIEHHVPTRKSKVLIKIDDPKVGFSAKMLKLFTRK